MVDTSSVLPIYKCFHYITYVALSALPGQMFTNNDTQRFSSNDINHTSYFKTNYNLDLQSKCFRVKVHGVWIFLQIISYVFTILLQYQSIFKTRFSITTLVVGLYIAISIRSHELEILTKPMYSPTYFCWLVFTYVSGNQVWCWC